MPPKAAPAHPKYEEMVKAAIVALKDRNGSSVPAIAKYIGSSFKLPGNYKKILSTQLKNLVASGKLVKVKASYKLGEALKKVPKKPKKAKKPKKKAPKKKKPKAKKAKVRARTNVLNFYLPRVPLFFFSPPILPRRRRSPRPRRPPRRRPPRRPRPPRRRPPPRRRLPPRRRPPPRSKSVIPLYLLFTTVSHRHHHRCKESPPSRPRRDRARPYPP